MRSLPMAVSFVYRLSYAGGFALGDFKSHGFFAKVKEMWEDPGDSKE